MLIGITGTIGAGKGTVVDYLKQKGFLHYSARTFLTKEIEKRGMPLIRDSYFTVSNELRQKGGPAYIIYQLLDQARDSNAPAIIESVRNVGELETLRKEGAFIIAVNADQKLRYERIFQRGASTDHITYEKFVEDEYKESLGSHAWDQNLPVCISMADHVILNNGLIEQLHAQVDKLLVQYMHEKK
jgi:dephospho-CoA kinase